VVESIPSPREDTALDEAGRLHAEAQRQVRAARVRCDELVRASKDTTTAEYELNVALAVAKLAEQQLHGV